MGAKARRPAVKAALEPDQPADKQRGRDPGENDERFVIDPVRGDFSCSEPAIISHGGRVGYRGGTRRALIPLGSCQALPKYPLCT